MVGSVSDCFAGVGRLKDVQVALHVDPGVRPVAQPMKRAIWTQGKS